MAFQLVAIGIGWDASVLTNIEDLTAGGLPFNPVEDLGKFSDGQDVLRGDGVTIPQGQPSTGWYTGALYLAHWNYLYNTILVGKRSGRVTIYTRRYDPDVYNTYNAILTIPPPPTLRKTNLWYEDVNWAFQRLKRHGAFSSAFSKAFDRRDD